MEINIKLMTEEAYKTLQKNIDDVYNEILKHPSDCTWLKDYLGFEPFEVKKYVINDLELKDDENYENVAFENSVELYEKLKDLPRYIICNNRFWEWITFEKAYKQAIHSIKFTKDILKNWWLSGNSRRNLLLGVISRYYFYAEVTVDGSLTDKFEITKYALKHGEAYRNIAFRNIGMLKSVSLEYFRVQKDFTDKTGVVMNQFYCRELMKEASRMGSVMLIDLATNKEIYDYLYSKLEKISKANAGK